MVDIATAAVSNSLRVGLHVVSNYKRPVLEIYHQVCNRFGPEHDLDMPLGSDGKNTKTCKHQIQEIFVQFTLVNIGGARAEDIELRISGNLQRHYPRKDFGGAFRAPIPQFAPGQSHFLFRFEENDLYEYPEGSEHRNGLKQDSFTISVEYNGPRGVWNWILGLPSRLRGKKQFHTEYRFSPAFVEGDLPPAEYGP